jgi:hypothetical protein
MSDLNPTLPFFLQRRRRTNVRSRAWTIALTFLIGGWLLAPNGEPTHATANDLSKLSGAQIRARFSDRQIADGVHWRDVYERDGTFRSYLMGKTRTGKWFVHTDDLCLDLPGSDGGCFEVTFSSWVVMTPKGETGLTIVGVLEPISDRE